MSDNDAGDGSDCRIGCVFLSKHPGKAVVAGSIARQVWLHEVVPNYKGPAIYLDFDEDDELLGIEIIEELD